MSFSSNRTIGKKMCDVQEKVSQTLTSSKIQLSNSRNLRKLHIANNIAKGRIAVRCEYIACSCKGIGFFIKFVVIKK